MGKSLFNRGYKFAREEAERQERARANAGKMLFEFFLPKPDKKNRSPEADIIFLTDEPINFYMHNIPRGDNRFDSYVCSAELVDGCPDCERGDRPSYKGAYLIYDERPYEYTDKNGKKVQKDGQVRLYFAGTRMMSQLDRINSKKGLLFRECTIIRTGSGTSTNYTIEAGDEVPMNKKTLANYLADLHEDVRDLFDGSEDSLYDIVQEQLAMRMRDFNGEDDSDDNEDDEDDYDDTLIDDSEDEEDEDEEDEKPKRGLFRKTSKKPTVKKSVKKRK